MYQEGAKDTIRSEEIQEVLGTPPSWLTRWGALLVLVTFVVFAWLGYFYRYPDTITSDIVVTTNNPPRRLVAGNTVTIVSIEVENEDTVAMGQTLMVFRNLAKFQDVLSLEDKILSVRPVTDSSLASLEIPNYLILGQLQEPLYDFLEKQDAMRNVVSGRLDRLGIEELRQRIRREEASMREENAQLANVQQQLALAEQRYIRERNLLNANLSTADRVRQMEEDKLQYERLLRETESNIKDSEFEIRMMRNSIVNLQSGSRTSSTTASSELRESFLALQTAVEEWKERNLLVSPIDGVVIIPPNIYENQMVGANDELAVLLPFDPEGIVGWIELDLKGSGKVQEGQEVLVKFASYPFQEFGGVVGVVTQKARIPTRGNLLIKVNFPDGMVTTTGRQLEPGQEMIGKALITTEEKRLISWIFERF